MKKITQEELNIIIKEHKLWLKDRSGKRADLSDCDISKLDMSHADMRYSDVRGSCMNGTNMSHSDMRLTNMSHISLCCADMGYSNMSGTDMSHANMSGANISGTNMRGTNMRGANMNGANMSYSDMCCADMRYADMGYSNMSYVDMRDADMCYSNMSYVDVRCANMCSAGMCGANTHNIIYNEATSFFAIQCPEEGSFTGYKKCQGKLVTLQITEDAERSSATSRKCRCSKAKVISIEDGLTSIVSNYDKNFMYVVGEVAEVKDFDKDRWNECSTGIHFFITKQEAINY